MTTLDALEIGAGDALFADLDGTLAEIGPDPDAIWLTDEAKTALEAIARALAGAVAVVSGRDVRDLARRTPDALWRAGGHGLEIVAPGEAVPPTPAPPNADVLERLREVAMRDGVRLEIKGPVVALHYRAAPEMGPACLEAAAAASEAAPGHVWQAGKMVVEVKPASAHKGRAIEALIERPPFAGRRPLMLGDDTTDEDAIAAAQALGGIGVKVGDGDSAARLRARDPAAVRAWLFREAARLSSAP